MNNQQADVVSAARSQIGKPYQWGGENNPGFDCSGLCQWAYAQIGVSIPRTSQEQAQGGNPVAYSDLQPGDLIIYYPDATHVALYSGNGNVIEAATEGEPVKEVPINAAGPYLTGRRYLAQETKAVETLYYPDVSNNNWERPQDAIDFLAQLKPEGFAGVVHKVSEGSYYADPFWPAVREWCENNDLPWLGYHYITEDNPSAQASTWTENNGGPFAMMDFEANSGDLQNFWAVVNAFNAAGVNVTLAYIPQWYLDEVGGDLSTLAPNGVALVSSAYPAGAGYASTIYDAAGGASGEGWAPYASATPRAWQFTDQALVAGIRVDCNAYQGTDLNQLFTGAAA